MPLPRMQKPKSLSNALFVAPGLIAALRFPLRHCLAVMCLLLTACAGSASKPPVNRVIAYDYHAYPPYVIADQGGAGISKEWVRFMNHYLQTTQLQLAQIDRPSLNALLQKREPMLVLWANPNWFRRFPQLKPSMPILLDGDMLVSLRERPVTKLLPQAGKRLCSIKGYVYPTIEPWIQNGALQRIERASTEDCMDAIKDNAADLALMNRSQWLFMPETARRQQWYMIPEPIDAFARHVLIASEYESLLPEINSAIIAVNNDPHWQQFLLEYGSQDFLNLFDLRLEQLQTLPLPKSQNP